MDTMERNRELERKIRTSPEKCRHVGKEEVSLIFKNKNKKTHDTVVARNVQRTEMIPTLCNEF